MVEEPAEPPRLPSPDEIAQELGPPLFTFVAQPRLAEWAINARREGGRIRSASVLYWFFADPADRAFGDTLWEAVRTSLPAEPPVPLAEATARHLEDVIRRVGGRPEEMSLEEWMRWDPMPRVADVTEASLVVGGRRQPAVAIEQRRFLAFGTIVRDRTVTIAGERAKLELLDLSLVDRVRKVTAARR